MNADRLGACVALAISLAILSESAATASPGNQATVSRFAALLKPDPTQGLDVATESIDALPLGNPTRAGWDQFRATHGADWQVYLDRRSGAPMLASGPGVPWPLDGKTTLDALDRSLREFVRSNAEVLLADDRELVLNREGSGEIADDVWQVIYDRVVSGLPVAGERYLFTVGHGRLTAFGAPRWSRIDVGLTPAIDGPRARRILLDAMKLAEPGDVEVVVGPTLTIVPLRAGPDTRGFGPYKGERGRGYGSTLAWRMVLRIPADREAWGALIDARTGAIVSLVDETRYARVKGGVYPHGNTQVCPGGCESPGLPMPFASVKVDNVSQTATSLGVFNCNGTTAQTLLQGTYVRITDEFCGQLAESVACNGDIDLKSSSGTNCSVPAGTSPGNTHAARTVFYHLNRAAEHARAWLPTLSWPSSTVLAQVNNHGLACDSRWWFNQFSFGEGYGNCTNAGEIAGIIDHEWGHALDDNDGGGATSPPEGYADIASMILLHDSCIGDGFSDITCGPSAFDYCETCTGYLDLDWDKRTPHTPSVPGPYFQAHSGCTTSFGPYGPCGKYDKCEAVFTGEAMYDLVARDLPAMGLEPSSAWALVDKLWFKSRLGSGGDEYNCALPSSDGCNLNSLFLRLRTVDDDDGNPANGTPHAAAIFAAFDRHGIACGTAADPSNQNVASCATVGVTTLSGAAGPTTSSLSWSAVPGAIGYRVLRSDLGCWAAMTLAGQTGMTTFSDAGVPNGLPLYYGVQALASNGACDGGPSNCLVVTPQSAAATIALDDSPYACTAKAFVSVVDGNAGTPTITAGVSSTTEPAFEFITLSRVAPGSATYKGSINLTTSPAVHDGVLSVANGNTVTARYTDANDGAGHTNTPRITTSIASCPAGGIPVKPVPDGSFGVAMTASRVAGQFGSYIAMNWDVATCSSPGHHVLYGYLDDLSTGSVLGSVCNLGTTGSATWFPPSNKSVWFVVVGDDGASTEGSWGTLSTGEQRGNAAVSGKCGMTLRDDSGACP